MGQQVAVEPQQHHLMGQQQQINTEQQQQNVEASTKHESTSPRLTYKQRRRLEQAKLRLKFPDRKRRGPTRGKKYGPRMWNSNSEEKIKINFIDELRCVVGEKAHKFICDCSNCGKYDSLEKVAGADVTEALSFQCSMLYKHWRFRLKEQHFRNKSVADAINSRPNTIDVGKWTWLVCEYWNGEKQKHISKVNTENKLKQTETPVNGVRSTARIFHDLINVPTTQPTQELDGSSERHETQQDPLHKGSGWELNAKKDYEALKMLHEKEVEKHGEDTLSVKDAYMEVFKQTSGYVKGLGPGVRPPKKCRADGESNEARASLSLQIQKLKDDAAAREASLASEIETLKASNDELKTSNEELIVSNDELKATVSRINIEGIKREKKLRDDMMTMFEQMRCFSCLRMQHLSTSPPTLNLLHMPLTYSLPRLLSYCLTHIPPHTPTTYYPHSHLLTN
ncbi:Fibronectin-binding protein PlpA [Bienertia sinuspersici]